MNRRRAMVAVGASVLLSALPSLAESLKIVRIGVLRQQPRAGNASFAAFMQGLKDLGYIEGRNLEIDYRQGEGGELIEQARDLVRSNIDLIYAPTAEEAQAARKSTSTIPIVVAVIGDPVATGLAKSLAQPGGNVTGLTAFGSNLSGKRLELLREVVPRLVRVAVIWNPAVPDKVLEWEDIQRVAKRLQVEMLSIEVRVSIDFNGAFEKIRHLRPDALLVLGDGLTSTHMNRIVDFVNQWRLPAMFSWKPAVERGALLSFGPDFRALHYQAARYVDRIVKGARPNDMPIEQPSRFELYINAKTAKSLGIAIPPSIRVQATRIVS